MVVNKLTEASVVRAITPGFGGFERFVNGP
jgi:hypothetical protein